MKHTNLDPDEKTTLLCGVSITRNSQSGLCWYEQIDKNGIAWGRGIGVHPSLEAAAHYFLQKKEEFEKEMSGGDLN